MSAFQINAKLLRAMLVTVEHAHAVKDIRYYLNGIFFEVLDNTDTLHMVATDGHRIAHAECTLVGDQPRAGGVSFTLKACGIKLLLATLKDVGEQVVELVHVAGGNVNDSGTLVVNTMTRQLASFETVSREGKFPDWRRVMPKPETRPQDYAPSARTDGELFNPLYLADAMKGLAAGAKVQNTVHPNVRVLLIGGESNLGGQNALVRVSGNGFEAECVIMGMRS